MAYCTDKEMAFEGIMHVFQKEGWKIADFQNHDVAEEEEVEAAAGGGREA